MDSDAAREKVGMTRSLSWGALYRGLRASEEYCSDYLRAATHKPCQRLFLACCARAVSVPFPADKLSQVHHGPSSRSGAILLSVRTPYPLLCPFGRDEGSQEGLPAPLRMGGAETNRRSPLLHATPVLLSPSQGCIPAWDDEEVPHGVCPPKWEYRDHPTPETMRRRASI